MVPRWATECSLGGHKRRINAFLFVDRDFEITFKRLAVFCVTIKRATTWKRLGITGIVHAH